MSKAILSRLRMHAAFLSTAVATSACIWSDRPKLSPDPLAVAGISAGYYEDCFYSVDKKTGVLEKSKDGCKSVRVDVHADGTVITQSPGDEAPSMIVINRISERIFAVQQGAGTGKYYFGFLSLDANRRGVMTVTIPSCKFSTELSQILERRVGVTTGDGDGENCNIKEIPPPQVRSLLRTLAESDGWTIEFKQVYTPLDDTSGAQRFQREKRLELEKSKSKK